MRTLATRTAAGAILGWGAVHALHFVVAGIVVGALASWGASRWLKSLVFGVSEHNPVIIFAAAAMVLGMASIAASFPLWRATRVDVVRNLHDA